MINALARHVDRHVFRHVRWHPPTDGYIKVKVDGSSFGNPSNTEFGGLLRDLMGFGFMVFLVLVVQHLIYLLNSQPFGDAFS